MAQNEYKNAPMMDVGNVWTTIYTAPVGKASMIVELDIASKGITGVQVSVRLSDFSTGDTVYLVKDAPVPLGSALQAIDGQKIVLESQDSIDVICETGGEVVDALMSLVEDINP